MLQYKVNKKVMDWPFCMQVRLMVPLPPLTTDSKIFLRLSPFQTDVRAKEHRGGNMGDFYGLGLVYHLLLPSVKTLS